MSGWRWNKTWKDFILCQCVVALVHVHVNILYSYRMKTHFILDWCIPLSMLITRSRIAFVDDKSNGSNNFLFISAITFKSAINGKIFIWIRTFFHSNICELHGTATIVCVCFGLRLKMKIKSMVYSIRDWYNMGKVIEHMKIRLMWLPAHRPYKQRISLCHSTLGHFIGFISK